MAIDSRTSKDPKASTISVDTVIDNFDQVILIDAGADGFKIQTRDEGICVIPTGVPISIAGPAGMGTGYIKIVAPDSGTLNVSVIKYS